MLTALPRHPAHFATLCTICLFGATTPNFVGRTCLELTSFHLAWFTKPIKNLWFCLLVMCQKLSETSLQLQSSTGRGAGGQPKCSKCPTGWATKAHVMQTRKLEIALSGRKDEFNIFEPPSRQISVKPRMPQTRQKSSTLAHGKPHGPHKTFNRAPQ